MNGGALTTLDRLALGGAAAIAAASAIVWIATGNLGSRPLEVAFGAIAAGSHLIWWTVGAVIVVRARGHRIGWLLVLASTFGAVAMGSWALAGGNAGPEASPVAAWAFLLVTATYGPWFVTLILAGMLLFPDGRLPGRRWRISASLIVGAVAVYAGAVLVLQGLLGGVTQGETLAVAASTLLAAALFQPLRGRVQRAMDRRFDRARYDGDRVVGAFNERLRGQIDLDTLSVEVRRVAGETVRPTSSAVWLRIVPDHRETARS